MAPTDSTTDEFFRVTEGFAFDQDGRGYVMRRGDVVDKGHPSFNKARLQNGLFEPVSASGARANKEERTFTATETATAAPGHPRAGAAPTAATLAPADAAPSAAAPAAEPSTPAPAATPAASAPVKADAAPAKKAATPRRAVKDEPQA